MPIPRKQVFGKGQQMPVRVNLRPGRDWCPAFLRNLRRLGSIQEAAFRAGLTVQMIADRRAQSPDFNTGCEQMLAQFAERQELRAQRTCPQAATLPPPAVEEA